MDKGLNDETVKVPITCLRLPGYFTSKDFWGWVFSTILSTSEIISYWKIIGIFTNPLFRNQSIFTPGSAFQRTVFPARMIGSRPSNQCCLEELSWGGNPWMEACSLTQAGIPQKKKELNWFYEILWVILIIDDQFQPFPWRYLDLWCAKHWHCEGMDALISDCDILGSIFRVRLVWPNHEGTPETTSQAVGQMLACAGTCTLVPMVICFLFAISSDCLINLPSTPTLLWIYIPAKQSLLWTYLFCRSFPQLRWRWAWDPLKEAWEIWPFLTEDQNVKHQTFFNFHWDLASLWRSDPKTEHIIPLWQGKIVCEMLWTPFTRAPACKRSIAWTKIACGAFWTLCLGQALFLALTDHWKLFQNIVSHLTPEDPSNLVSKLIPGFNRILINAIIWYNM